MNLLTTIKRKRAKRQRLYGLRTARQLLRQFCDKFTTEEVAESVELQVLLQYLQHNAACYPDNYIVPSDLMADALREHIGYDPKGGAR